jgi:hypothetical protein
MRVEFFLRLSSSTRCGRGIARSPKKNRVNLTRFRVSLAQLDSTQPFVQAQNTLASFRLNPLIA